MQCILITTRLKDRDIKLVQEKGRFKIEDNQNNELDNVVFIQEDSAKEIFNKRIEEMKGNKNDA